MNDLPILLRASFVMAVFAGCNSPSSGGTQPGAVASAASTFAVNTTAARIGATSAAPETPPASMTIPDGPIAGMIVGQAIAGPKVSIDFRNGEWDLDVDSSSVGKVGVYNVGITGAGVFTKTKASGSSAHAFLSSNPKDKKHGSMDLVSGNYAFWVDITKWNVPPYDATKGGIQEAGKASG